LVLEETDVVKRRRPVMTKNIFRVMFLVGLFVLSSLSAGCGWFGGGSKEVNALKLENSNLQGQVDRAERDLDDAREENRDLQTQLITAEAESTRIQSATPTAVATPGASRVITVSGSVLFRAGAADLTSAGKSKLDSVANDIKRSYSGRHLSVEGHTDSSPLVRTLGTWKTNMWLSANRARAVADHLISRGINKNLVSIVGHGASRPSGQGKDQDRRVEIVVLSN
jgi:outer membrane protein OmpA-like peptidoglycan-associated protein